MESSSAISFHSFSLLGGMACLGVSDKCSVSKSY